MTYVPGLDGLRVLAVAAALLYHLNFPHAPGGLLGVGMFFTLSGYLITVTLMRSWDNAGNLGLKTFWFRGFRRLMPAMITTVLATVLVTAVLFRYALSDRLPEALSTVPYVNNRYAIASKVSYLDNFSGPGPQGTYVVAISRRAVLFGLAFAASRAAHHLSEQKSSRRLG